MGYDVFCYRFLWFLSCSGLISCIRLLCLSVTLSAILPKVLHFSFSCETHGDDMNILSHTTLRLSSFSVFQIHLFSIFYTLLYDFHLHRLNLFYSITLCCYLSQLANVVFYLLNNFLFSSWWVFAVALKEFKQMKHFYGSYFKIILW